MEKFLAYIIRYLTESGFSASNAKGFAAAIMVVACVIGAYIIYLLLSKVANPIILRISRLTATKVDDILFRETFLKWCWWLIFGCVLCATLPDALAGYPTVSNWVATIADVATIALATKVVVEFVKGAFLIVFDNDKVDEEAEKLHLAQDNDEEYQYIPSHSLKGLQQMICIIIVAIGGILMVSVLLGKNPLIIVSGIGAGAAVLMLVFSDSILGVVAGIQLTANDMLSPGDWIIASKYGVNGRVQEVTLATVKVLNWDHTIVTIPPYKLISDSFQNWRRMETSGGRRVMRSINIDLSSIRFLTQKEKDEYELAPWALKDGQPETTTNITAFRRYLEYYITTLPTLRPTMLYMVRELQPTAQGLPIELYFFTSCTTWAAYEQIQAEVLDHVLATVPQFGLRVFQSPSGADIAGCSR